MSAADGKKKPFEMRAKKTRTVSKAKASGSKMNKRTKSVGTQPSDRKKSY